MPESLLHWDDLAVGSVFDIGPYTMSREEILAFAREYDPQPFHIDEQGAAQSIYGGIIASGWHTAAIAQKLLVNGFLNGAASLGSPGIESLRWRKPVYPGDELSLRLRVVNKEPSPKHDDRGILDVEHEVTNQKGELVMSYRARIMTARRKPTSG
jgi:acyl dehydratase